MVTIDTGMKSISIILIIVFFCGIAFAQSQGEYKPQPKYTQEERESVKKLAKIMDHVHVGMRKDELCEVFADYFQKGYRKDGNEEWITFSDQMMEGPGGDRISFYLRSGIVKGWEEKPAPE